jgi:glycosyltransferase involved in cell wall biosynthesis
MQGASLSSSGNNISICAVIPCFNEKQNLLQTVLRTHEHIENIVVVDDGSTDDSVETVKDKEYVTILKHEANLGKGAALVTGLSYASGKGYDYAICLDADLQHDPNSIPDFIEEMKLNRCDIVVGNRLNNIQKMPLQRRASNFLTSWMLSVKTGVKIKDSQSGYRLLALEKINKILPKFKGFEAESEMLVKAARNNFKICFTNIPTIYNDNKSKMKSFEAIIGFIKVLFI